MDFSDVVAITAHQAGGLIPFLQIGKLRLAELQLTARAAELRQGWAHSTVRLSPKLHELHGWKWATSK